MNHFIIYALIICTTPCIAQDVNENTERGPLSTHASTIFQLPSADFIPNSTIRAKRNDVIIHNSVTWINIYNNVPDQYIIDAELLNVKTSFYYGITDEFQIGVSVPTYLIGGGRLDGFIDSFHDVFGLKGNNRRESDSDQFQFSSSNFEPDLTSEVVLGDIMLSSRYQLIEATDGYPGFSIGLKTKLPTSTDLDWLKNDGIGVGVEYAISYQIGDFCFHNSSSIAYIGNSEILWKDVKPVQASIVAAIDYRVAEDWSLILQYIGTSELVNEFDEYSQWAHELTFGTRIGVSKHLSIEMAILENVILFNNSADIGFYIGMTLR